MRVAHALFQVRQIALTIVVETASDSLPIAPKQDRVRAESGHMCVAHALLQDRQIALAFTIASASDSLPIAPKQHHVHATRGDLCVAHALLQVRQIALLLVIAVCVSANNSLSCRGARSSASRQRTWHDKMTSRDGS